MVSRLDRGGKLDEARAFEVWEKIAGHEIGRHTYGTRLADGEFTVSVDSPAWAAELSAMAEQLRVRLNEEAGQNLVKTLRFTVSRRVHEEAERRESQRQASRRYGGVKVTPAPLSRTEREAVERSVAGIPDESLRAAALKATLADLEWKKGLHKVGANGKGEAEETEV
jgi:hypothetical protein